MNGMTGLDKIIEHIKQDAQAVADAKIAEAFQDAIDECEYFQ